MPFLRSAAKPQPVECFFCLSHALLPPGSLDGARKGTARAGEVSRWNWRCERCGCWNIKNERGEMVSDLPGMHDPTLNQRSFSLRATPSRSHLPSTSASASSPFCRSCTANQTLIMNMLANYLPEDDDPTYQSLYASLPTYLANLHMRYPPVCADCQPAVDAALRKSDQRAQGEALGFALRQGVKRQAETGSGGVGPATVLLWRIRGVLFCLGIVVGLGQTATALAPRYRRSLDVLAHRDRVGPAILCFHLLSVLWISWDPFWLRAVRTRSENEVKGRDLWVRNMYLILLLRVCVSVLLYAFSMGRYAISPILAQMLSLLELPLLVCSFSRLRLPRPIPMRLLRTTPPSGYSSPTHAPPPDVHLNHLSHMSLNAEPVLPANPIFGQTSLQPSPPPIPHEEPEPMDWEPNLPTRSLPFGARARRDSEMSPSPSKGDWDRFGIGKQRMFAQNSRHEETGLEALVAAWGLGGTTNSVHCLSVQPLPPQGGFVVDYGSTKRIFAVLVAVRLVAIVVISAISAFEPQVVSPKVSVIAHRLLRQADSVLCGVEVAAGVAQLGVLSLRSEHKGSLLWRCLAVNITRFSALGGWKVLAQVLEGLTPQQTGFAWACWATLDYLGCK